MSADGMREASADGGAAAVAIVGVGQIADLRAALKIGDPGEI